MVSPIWKRLYAFIGRGPFARGVRDIRRVLEIIKPGEEPYLIRDTVKLCFKLLFAALLIFAGGLWLLRIQDAVPDKPPFCGYTYIAALFCIVYIIGCQILYRTLEKEERKLLRQFESYLSDVRHHFHSCGMVEEALYDSLLLSEKEIAAHMERLYDALSEDDEEALSRYGETAPNKFFVTLLALSKITIQYGDTIKEGASLFLSNLNHLKNEVNIELLKRERLHHVFSGLVFILVLPVFFLKTIEYFGIGSLPELKSYYYGSYGMAVTILILISALCAYQIILRLKFSNRTYRREHRLLDRISGLAFVNFLIHLWTDKKPGQAYRLNRCLKRTGEGITLPGHLVQRGLAALSAFILVLILGIHGVSIKKWNLLRHTGGAQTGLSSALPQSSSPDEYEGILSDLCREFKKEGDPERLWQQANRRLQKTYGMTGEENREAVVKEVWERLLQYRAVHFRPFILLAALAAAVLASYIPLLSLKIRGCFLQADMEEEVMQLQSILIMLMYIRQMNVLLILEWMENFSDIFRASIMECVDDYTWDEEEAFRKLKEQEPFPPFTRIIEDLEACDRVGIEAAFDEMSGQRNYLEEKRKQENEIALSNKGVIGRAAAYVPLALTIGLYLIVPFVLESMNQLMGYVQELKI